MMIIDKIRHNLVETGIYIRAKRNGKWQSVDYINLTPNEVQEADRWGDESWNMILDQILGRIGQAVTKEEENHIREIVRGLLAMLRSLEIQAKKLKIP